MHVFILKCQTLLALTDDFLQKSPRVISTPPKAMIKNPQKTGAIDWLTSYEDNS